MQMFESAYLGPLKLKNRLIASPVTPNFATEDGFVTDKTLQFYKQRANSGVALVITEGAYISPSGKAYSHQLGAYNPILKDGLKTLSDTIHAGGAKAALQLHHAGWRTQSSVTGREVLSCESASCYASAPKARELSTQEAEQVIADFANAALLAKNAGFDGVDIHGAHGYLITCFMSPANNHRTDRFGGTTPLERARFAVELVKAIRAKVGETDFIIMMKISADEFISNGYTLDDMKIIAKELEKAGLDAITASAGTTGGSVPFDPQFPQYTMRTLPMGTPHNAFAHFAQELRNTVSIPVIAVGKIHTKADLQEIFSGQKADFVALGRSLIADPLWIRKTQENHEDEIRPCISCNQGCFDRLANQQEIRCTVNPDMGKFSGQQEKCTKAKYVMVVGGGAAGMQAAIEASKKGHRVSLWERTENLGGQMILAAIPPDRQEITNFLEYLIRQLKKSPVEIHLGIEATKDLIAKENPDVVILATGGNPVMPGAFQKGNSIAAWDLLRMKERPAGNYVVLGGGLVGCETADLLAEDPQNTVTIVEMLPEIARDAGGDIKNFLHAKFNRYGVRILCQAKLESFADGQATVAVGGRQESFPCDYLVIAVGTRAEQRLASEADQQILSYSIGDALRPKRILDAVADGARIGSLL